MAGVIAYSKIPVAALPSYNTPVINVSAALPGASPETMATSVALQLEKQFQTIPGLNVISSTNTLGSTSVTLEFDEGRDIDAAAVDVQAALLRAQRTLPLDMTTPPSYRKVNPADAPVLLHRADLAVAEPVGPERLRRAPDLADAVDARRRGAGQHLRPEALRGARARAARRAGGAQHQPRRADHGAAARPTPTRRSARSKAPTQTLTLQANRQLRNAAEFADLIVSSRNGNPVRLRDVAQVEDSFETVKTAATFNGETSITLAVLRQPDANTVKVVDAVRAALPGFQAQLPQSVQHDRWSTTARSRSATRCTT